MNEIAVLAVSVSGCSAIVALIFGYLMGRRYAVSQMPWITHDAIRRATKAESLLDLQTQRAELAERQLQMLSERTK